MTDSGKELRVGVDEQRPSIAIRPYYWEPIDPKIIEIQRRYNDNLQLIYEANNTLTLRRRRIWWKPWTWFSLKYTWRLR
jgi:hypothetical protein